MKKYLILVFCTIVLFPITGYCTGESRGLLVAQLDDPSIIASRKGISRIITTAKKCSINTLFIQVYRSNRAWFDTKTADPKPYQECLKGVGEDPLTLLITQAHAQKIKVYAWLNLLSLGNNPQALMLKKHGINILTRNLDRKKTIKDYKIGDQYFLEPGDPAVRDELSRIVEELLSTHPGLDGILFDYIRYPDTKPDYGYTPANTLRFKNAHPEVKIDKENPVWKSWKREQVNQLLQILTAKARNLHPGISVAATGCAPYVRAYYEAYQDWPSWVNNDMVDFVLLMAYPANLADFNKDINEARLKAKDMKKLCIALPAYKLKKSPEILAQEFHAAKNSGSGGYAIFHYDSLAESPALTDAVKNY